MEEIARDWMILRSLQPLDDSFKKLLTTQIRLLFNINFIKTTVAKTSTHSRKGSTWQQSFDKHHVV